MTEQLKLPEVAQRLGVSEKTARRYVKSGTLPSMFVGGSYRVSEEDLQAFLQGAKVTLGGGSPKELASPSQPSFNGLLEEEQRESVYGPWLEFINRYAEQWEKRIETGDLDLGSINEFVRVCEELGPVLQKLNAQELTEFPVEVSDTFGGREALTGRAIWRLSDLLDPMITAGAAKFADSELEQLRRRRENVGQLRQAANG